MIEPISFKPDELFFFFLPNNSRQFIKYLTKTKPSLKTALLFLKENIIPFIPEIKNQTEEAKSLYSIAFALLHTSLFNKEILLHPIAKSSEFWETATLIYHQISINCPWEELKPFVDATDGVNIAEPDNLTQNNPQLRVNPLIIAGYPGALSRFCNSHETDFLVNLLSSAHEKSVAHILKTVIPILKERDLSFDNLKTLITIDPYFTRKFSANREFMLKFLCSTEVFNQSFWNLLSDHPNEINTVGHIPNLSASLIILETSQLLSFWAHSPGLRTTIAKILSDRGITETRPPQLITYLEKSSNTFLIELLLKKPLVHKITLEILLKRNLSAREKAQIYLSNKYFLPTLIREGDLKDISFLTNLAEIMKQKGYLEETLV